MRWKRPGGRVWFYQCNSVVRGGEPKTLVRPMGLHVELSDVELSQKGWKIALPPSPKKSWIRYIWIRHHNTSARKKRRAPEKKLEERNTNRSTRSVKSVTERRELRKLKSLGNKSLKPNQKKSPEDCVSSTEEMTARGGKLYGRWWHGRTWPVEDLLKKLVPGLGSHMLMYIKMCNMRRSIMN